MSNLPLDENGREGIGAALNTNPTLIVAATVNPTSHALSVVDGTGQTNNGNHGGNALIDENGRAAWYGLSSANNGEKIIVYANSTGHILIESI